jgi:hypothetical protein
MPLQLCSDGLDLRPPIADERTSAVGSPLPILELIADIHLSGEVTSVFGIGALAEPVVFGQDLARELPLRTFAGHLDSPRLRHLRETNGFFTRLAHACRTSEPTHRLAMWWGERTCAERWQSLVRPDGLGVLEGPAGSSVRFALELDRGTESRDRLANKLERYLLIASGADAPAVVLFCFLSAEREANAHQVLQQPGIPVATSTLERHFADTLGLVWRPVRADRRVRLVDVIRVRPGGE